MSQSDWIITLTIIITVVPVLKMARAKRFSFYNIAIVIIGVVILILSVRKNRNDSASEKENKNQMESYRNRTEITMNRILGEAKKSQVDLDKIKTSLNKIGLSIDPESGEVYVENKQKIKTLLTGNSSTNVTSINQQGGQTARDIINN